VTCTGALSAETLATIEGLPLCCKLDLLRSKVAELLQIHKQDVRLLLQNGTVLDEMHEALAVTTVLGLQLVQEDELQADES